MSAKEKARQTRASYFPREQIYLVAVNDCLVRGRPMKVNWPQLVDRVRVNLSLNTLSRNRDRKRRLPIFLPRKKTRYTHFRQRPRFLFLLTPCSRQSHENYMRGFLSRRTFSCFFSYVRDAHERKRVTPPSHTYQDILSTTVALLRWR